ncbi:unnamed protein product [Symbiodinium pilosum]|uniref:CS domain-containing protein n=1 Tax=Symbiodinium pilosum TaxID=2952 RepID=A0A812WIM7_SYMPI|nr:unnamed protein product [Symbiodinium pilosum]
MDAFTHEQACKATAALRIQHDLEAKAREGPKADPGPRTSDMTVGEALQEIEDNMMSEKFWVDLGQGIFETRQALQQNSEAGQKKAAACLKEVSDQIQDLQSMYFANERNVIEQIRRMFESKEPVTLERHLTGVRTTRSEGQETGKQQHRAKGLQQAGSEIIHQQQTKQGPWNFHEVSNKSEITVEVQVPPSTQKSDITVKMQPSRLVVNVRGHEAMLLSGLAMPADMA